MSRKKKVQMTVGEIYTTNDGNDCEAEVAIKRVAEKSTAPNNALIDRNNWSHQHVEFEIYAQTPENTLHPDDHDYPDYMPKLRLSRENMIRLKILLQDLDLESDTPVMKCGW